MDLLQNLIALFQKLIDLFLHLDRYLGDVLRTFGGWTYLILFLVIFCETGLVVTPFLPGDSLLFAAGTFAALPNTPISLLGLFAVLTVAAILGDTVNYWVGRKLGPKVFKQETSRLLNKKHLERTHAFYERHGGKTIIIARFVPIIRTFAPFVAGIGEMSYGKFIAYNVIGGVAWVGLCTGAGYFFGNLPFVQKNFSAVILAIIFISVLPAGVEIFREWRKAKKGSAAPAA